MLFRSPKRNSPDAYGCPCHLSVTWRLGIGVRQKKRLQSLRKRAGWMSRNFSFSRIPAYEPSLDRRCKRSTSEAFGENAVTEPAVADYQRALSKLVHYRSDDACTGENDLGALGL